MYIYVSDLKLKKIMFKVRAKFIDTEGNSFFDNILLNQY